MQEWYLVKYQKYMAGIDIFYIVICKLYYKYKLYPIVLLLIDKNSELSFYFFIFLHDLAISL